VFEKMAAAHPELRYRSAGHDVVSYFEGGIDDGERLGEDRMFCRRWRKLGGDIHLLVRAAMSHTGPYTFSGDFSRSV